MSRESIGTAREAKEYLVAQIAMEAEWRWTGRRYVSVECYRTLYAMPKLRRFGWRPRLGKLPHL